MTIEGGVPESEAIDYCRKHSAPKDFQKFMERLNIMKSGRRP